MSAFRSRPIGEYHPVDEDSSDEEGPEFDANEELRAFMKKDKDMRQSEMEHIIADHRQLMQEFERVSMHLARHIHRAERSDRDAQSERSIDPDEYAYSSDSSYDPEERVDDRADGNEEPQHGSLNMRRQRFLFAFRNALVTEGAPLDIMLTDETGPAPSLLPIVMKKFGQIVIHHMQGSMRIKGKLLRQLDRAIAELEPSPELEASLKAKRGASLKKRAGA